MFDEQFVLRDKESGQPLAGAPYRILNGAGAVVSVGVTNEGGQTDRVRFSRAEKLKVFWGS